MPRAIKSASKSKPKKAARKAKKKLPRGRPSKFTPAIARKIIDGLSKGIPLTIICASNSMPCDDTVRNWAAADPAFSRDIGRARENGFDQIAQDALRLSDGALANAYGLPGTGEAGARVAAVKLAVETRLKLLAKWDPKRYGDKITQEISGPEGGPIQTEGDFRPTPEDEAVIRRIAETRAKLKQSREEA